ncbi:MAG: type II CRISPR-associated endonuclease Cas1 [Spirochaetales bacterium]|nr:type II CRISPR-associated endonuclease Cas1 [Spirochaetales bacterium]
MLHQIVEISEEGRYLSSRRGSLQIKQGNDSIGSVPFDDIAVLLITARGATLSKESLIRVNEHGGVVILCGKNYAPASYIFPHSSHYEHTGRLLDQIESSVPLKKQIWKSLIQAKIRHQAQILSFYHKKEYKQLEYLSEKVTSGDKENLEAYAARIYWKGLFGDGFIRDYNGSGINALLNYGYGVLRGMTARAVCSVGLSPALGVHHKNRSNNLCLVDDLIEPYRPLFDVAAYELSQNGDIQITPEVKRKIIQLCWLDFESPKGKTPMIRIIENMAMSLVNSFQEKKNKIDISPLPDDYRLAELVELCF